VVGDWAGSGHAGVGLFDPATATWYLRNEAGPGFPDAGMFQYGAAGWGPVAGGWDGAKAPHVGVFDPAFSPSFSLTVPATAPIMVLPVMVSSGRNVWRRKGIRQFSNLLGGTR
jgi:hypothetical protein